MWTSVNRANTLRCQLVVDSGCPTGEEIRRWLRIPASQVAALHVDKAQRATYVTLQSAELFDKLSERLCPASAMQLSSGKLTPVAVSVAPPEALELRIFNVPLDVADHEFTKALAPFGKVQHIRREVVKGVLTGVRAMRLAQPVSDGEAMPTTLDVCGCQAVIEVSREVSWCMTSSQEDGACLCCQKEKDLNRVRALIAHSGEVMMSRPRRQRRA